VSVNPSGIPLWMAFKPQLPALPTFDAIAQNYQRYRIPRPPEFDPEGTTPGLICWGTVGQMPQALPMPGVDFNVNTERSRVSEDVRIENPDDPSQYVIADRALEITFDSAGNAAPPGPNTSSQPAPGMSDYTVAESEGFIPAGSGTRNNGTQTFRYAGAA